MGRKVQYMALGLAFFTVLPVLFLQTTAPVFDISSTMLLLQQPKQNEKKSKPINYRTATCTVQKWGQPYIEEWLDYTLGVLRFDHVFLYDNSDDFEMHRDLRKSYLTNDKTAHVTRHTSRVQNQTMYTVGKVTYTHWPGTGKQMPAFRHCVQMIVQDQLNYSWAANIDLDEFIVLKKNHSTIADLLKYMVHLRSTKDQEKVNQTRKAVVPKPFDPAQPIQILNGAVVRLQQDNLKMGGLVLNWIMFDHNNQANYSNLPMSLRFQRRETYTNACVKSIVRVDTIRDVLHLDPHSFPYMEGYGAVNTNGDYIWAVPTFSRKGPQDVATIYHYYTKSLQEYAARCKRGRANAAIGKDRKTLPYCVPWGEMVAKLPSARRYNQPGKDQIIDDTVWRLLQKEVPKYRKYGLSQQLMDELKRCDESTTTGLPSVQKTTRTTNDTTANGTKDNELMGPGNDGQDCSFIKKDLLNLILQ